MVNIVNLCRILINLKILKHGCPQLCQGGCAMPAYRAPQQLVLTVPLAQAPVVPTRINSAYQQTNRACCQTPNTVTWLNQPPWPTSNVPGYLTPATNGSQVNYQNAIYNAPGSAASGNAPLPNFTFVSPLPGYSTNTPTTIPSTTTSNIVYTNAPFQFTTTRMPPNNYQSTGIPFVPVVIPANQFPTTPGVQPPTTPRPDYNNPNQNFGQSTIPQPPSTVPPGYQNPNANYNQVQGTATAAPSEYNRENANYTNVPFVPVVLPGAQEQGTVAPQQQTTTDNYNNVNANYTSPVPVIPVAGGSVAQGGQITNYNGANAGYVQQQGGEQTTDYNAVNAGFPEQQGQSAGPASQPRPNENPAYNLPNAGFNAAQGQQEYNGIGAQNNNIYNDASSGYNTISYQEFEGSYPLNDQNRQNGSGIPILIPAPQINQGVSGAGAGVGQAVASGQGVAHGSAIPPATGEGNPNAVYNQGNAGYQQGQAGQQSQAGQGAAGYNQDNAGFQQGHSEGAASAYNQGNAGFQQGQTGQQGQSGQGAAGYNQGYAGYQQGAGQQAQAGQVGAGYNQGNSGFQQGQAGSDQSGQYNQGNSGYSQSSIGADVDRNYNNANAGFGQGQSGQGAPSGQGTSQGAAVPPSTGEGNFNFNDQQAYNTGNSGYNAGAASGTSSGSSSGAVAGAVAAGAVAAGAGVAANLGSTTQGQTYTTFNPQANVVTQAPGSPQGASSVYPVTSNPNAPTGATSPTLQNQFQGAVDQAGNVLQNGYNDVSSAVTGATNAATNTATGVVNTVNNTAAGIATGVAAGAAAAGAALGGAFSGGSTAAPVSISSGAPHVDMNYQYTKNATGSPDFSSTTSEQRFPSTTSGPDVNVPLNDNTFPSTSSPDIVIPPANHGDMNFQYSKNATGSPDYSESSTTSSGTAVTSSPNNAGAVAAGAAGVAAGVAAGAAAGSTGRTTAVPSSSGVSVTSAFNAPQNDDGNVNQQVTSPGTPEAIGSGAATNPQYDHGNLNTAYGQYWSTSSAPTTINEDIESSSPAILRDDPNVIVTASEAVPSIPTTELPTTSSSFSYAAMTRLARVNSPILFTIAALTFTLF